MRLLCFLFVPLCIAAVPAFAADASFNCQSAALVDEKLICRDALLSEADGTLGQSYSALMDSINPTRQASLRADQHSWLLLRNAECGISKQTKVTDSNRTGFVDCFLAAYEERQADLEAIKANPDRMPIEISTPIRKSRYADDAQPSMPAPAINSTKLAARVPPVFVWTADDRLIAIGKLNDGPTQLYIWGPEAMALSAEIDRPDTVQRLCIRDNKVVLIRKTTPDAPFETSAVDLTAKAPQPLAWVANSTDRTCGDPARHQIVSPNGKEILDLGSKGGDDRFVSLKDGNQVLTLAPPLRLDRRIDMTAQYLSASDSFVVYPASRPDDVRKEMERRWAKTDCLPFWQVAAASGTVTRSCIPFGPYINEVPVPLLAKNGLYFTAGSYGLYKKGDDVASRVTKGDTAAASVAPNGCLIAYAAAPREDGTRPLNIFDACKAK